MTISSISGSYTYPHPENGVHTRKQELDALTKSLQTGDLQGAQQAFGALQQGQPSADQSGIKPNSAVIADISALGKALAANDIKTAQHAFAALRNDVKNTLPPLPTPTSMPVIAQADASSEDKKHQAFDELATALKNGNLSAAKSAFVALQTAARDARDTSTSTDTSSAPTRPPLEAKVLGHDFATLGAALQHNDLQGAQTVFESLLSHLQASTQNNPSVQQYQQSDSDTTTNVSVTA